ncbi:hypothetical protein [Brevundimonas bullata]|uniref:hypothetical protein n=1 Tax=Brevundimonas bullata TaxID=13160 RepID=UPI000FAD1D32
MKYHAITSFVAALAFAGPVAAEPFKSFVDICVSNDASAPAIERVLSERDWVEMPAESSGDMGSDFQDPSMHLNFDPNGLNEAELAAAAETMEMVLIGWGDGESIFDIEGFKFDACMLVSPNTDSPTLNQRMTAYLGFPPDTGEGTVWAYSKANGRIVSEMGLAELDDDQANAAIRQRQIYMVFLIDQDDMAGLVLGAFRPAS